MNIRSGIHKFILFFLMIFSSMCFNFGIEAKAMVSATDKYYINDYANVINSDVEEKILKINKNYENTTEKPQVVVTTVNDLEGIDVNQYALELFEKLKIGNKDNDNGVLILLSAGDRAIKIEVGYGLEGVLNDALCGKILDSSLNLLGEGDYSQAISDIFDNVVYRIAEEYDYEIEDVEASTIVDVEGALTLGTCIMIAIIIIVVLVLDWRFFDGLLMELVGELVLYALFNSDNDSSFGDGSNFGGGRDFGEGGSSGGGGASRSF